MNDIDILFISESHGNCLSMPEITGFKVVGDPKFPLISTHGGIVAYIKNDIYEHIQSLRFSKCSLSFKLGVAPNIFFMGTYMYPYDSHNYHDGDFALLSSDIEYWLCKGMIPFIGGDLNSRIGDLNAVSTKTLKWRYADNVDTCTNKHGKMLHNICELLKILPINHCKYYDHQFDGGFTYYKGNKNSQIDFVITNNDGRRLVKEFEIIQTGWHSSDHLPILLKVAIPFCLSAMMLMRRSGELKPYIPSQQPLLKTHRYKFNEQQVHNELIVKANDLNAICFQNPQCPAKILDAVEKCINPILTVARIRNANMRPKEHTVENVIVRCDQLFKQYTDNLNDSTCSIEDVRVSYENYQKQRGSLNKAILQGHEDEYLKVMDTKDDHALWQKINWSGKLNSKPNKSPDICELAEHFETLYKPVEAHENEQIKSLQSPVYIPANDDEITEHELNIAVSSMKKGGWDYSLPVLKMLMQCIPAVLLLLLNLLFFCVYPLKLALSILHAIPKTGNLMLSTNYRGIQMQPLLALVYDRIIAARLLSWAKISHEQTAFQKGKGTLNHIFTLRVLIALCKRHKKILYVGFFDLSKAFDKVSRVELLKALIKLGIGSCLLEAIKATYRVTRCILKSCGKLSDVFHTYSGIKQGAPSSVILFIIFMDDVIEVIKQKCINEAVINNLHVLLHADDTLVFSLSHELFVKKCNILINTFHQKKLLLNLKKSGYMIIHDDKSTLRIDLKLESGWLPYRESVVYLGSLFSDSGMIHQDVIQHSLSKEKAVSIKLANFVTNNLYAPVTVKFKVMNSCVTAAILYACETWGGSNLSRIEAIHRKAIKVTLNMKFNTPNDIVYVESGCHPLIASISKRQFNFWQKILNDITANPDSPITMLYLKAIEAKLPIIKHYQNLHTRFTSDTECYQYYRGQEMDTIRERIKSAAVRDVEGLLGTYNSINSTLQSPEFYSVYIINESDRLILTKYRTGSHALNIQKGRYNRIPREDRLCKCKEEVQDLTHIIFRCQLIAEARNIIAQHNSLQDFFNDLHNASTFLKMAQHYFNLQW